MIDADEIEPAKVPYQRQTWAVSFACSVISKRKDIDFQEVYDVAYSYVVYLPNILALCPKSAAKEYLNGSC